MDHLWAPWRMAYVTAPKDKPAAPPTGPDCFMCRAAAAAADRENLLVHRTERSVVVLNRFPYNNGHLLVCPRAHKGRLVDLQLVARRMIGILEKRMRPDGFNVGLNLGAAAGAGVPGHLHWHVVPRWNGDANFMAVTGDTKVISQSLDALFDLVTDELKQ
jgi:ATP adenylyltransferase